jgi:phenylalanyl-tRNA synthetase beta chain
MRSSLIPGLLDNIKYNASHKADRVRVFELGKVFARDAAMKDGALSVEGVAQSLKLAGAAWGAVTPEQWGSAKRATDFFDVKADIAALLPVDARFVTAQHPLLHPGRSAQILIGNHEIGWIGELHPKHLAVFSLNQAPVVFELDASALQVKPLPDFQMVSKQPFVRRDMALVVANPVESLALIATLRAAAPVIVREISVFDIYRGAGLADGQKSVAIRILMQDTERTLADADIDAACQKMLAAAQQTHGATLRA